MKRPKPWRDFRVPVYGSRVLAYRTAKQYAAACESLGIEWDSEAVDGVVCQANHDSGHTVFIVGWFNNEPSSLVHEIGHLAIFVLVRAGMDPRDSNGEALCYLLGTLCQLFEGKRAS